MGLSLNIWCYSPPFILNMIIIVIIIKLWYRILIQLIHIFFISYLSKIHFKNLLSSHVRLIYLFFLLVTSRPNFCLHYSFCHSCSALPTSVYFANKTNATGRSQYSQYTQWDESPCARVQEWPCTELETGKPRTSTLCVALCDFCPRESFLKLTVTLSTAHTLSSKLIYILRQSLAQGLYNGLHSFGTILHVRGIHFFPMALFPIKKYIRTCTWNKLIMEHLAK
jgi:hypothetical protein